MRRARKTRGPWLLRTLGTEQHGHSFIRISGDSCYNGSHDCWRRIFIVTMLAKEQKTSEFRQVWIDHSRTICRTSSQRWTLSAHACA